MSQRGFGKFDTGYADSRYKTKMPELRGEYNIGYFKNNKINMTMRTSDLKEFNEDLSNESDNDSITRPKLPNIKIKLKINRKLSDRRT
jgi:hypothetical protein